MKKLHCTLAFLVWLHKVRLQEFREIHQLGGRLISSRMGKNLCIRQIWINLLPCLVNNSDRFLVIMNKIHFIQQEMYRQIWSLLLNHKDDLPFFLAEWIIHIKDEKKAVCHMQVTAYLLRFAVGDAESWGVDDGNAILFQESTWKPVINDARRPAHPSA